MAYFTADQIDVFPIHIGINQGFNLVNGKAVSR